MPSFWKHVNAVLQRSDIILEVLDARFIEETRHSEIERKIQGSGKQILYVINKSDLADIPTLQIIKKRLQPSIFISSTDRLGTTLLKKKLFELARGKEVVVGVVGYPNVGKSSVINALAGRKAARTSAESGFTKGLQKVRISPRIVLLDTPGVFPRKEQAQQKYALFGAIDYAKIKDPELAAIRLIQEHSKAITSYYGVDGVGDVEGTGAEEILEGIAKAFHKLRKGGQADLEATARMILRDWQTGKIRSTGS